MAGAEGTFEEDEIGDDPDEGLDVPATHGPTDLRSELMAIRALLEG